MKHRAAAAMRLADQVAQIGALPGGWLDGDGRAFTASELAWVEDLLGRILAARALPMPHVYPNPEGRIEAEWSFATWDVLLRFDPAERSISLLGAPHHKGEPVERTFPGPPDAGAAAEIAELVSTYARGLSP